MTVEEIKALYFDDVSLKEPATRLYQLNTDGYRYYYQFNEQGEPEFYPSVTTMIRQVMPTPSYLIDWIAANGKELATEKRDLAADYGTFMHKEFETLVINRSYDFDMAAEELKKYMDANNIPERLYNEWLVKIKKDVLSFAQFMKDYEVQPLAIEIGLAHPVFKYAGCIDMPCVITDPKDGLNYTAIVDFKSGRKGFFEDHEIQLHLYRMMWDENFPDAKIERLFNLSPKDWRKAPTYNLKEQTDAKSAEKIPHLLALAALADESRDNTITIVKGVVSLDDGELKDNVLTLSLSELIKSKREKKEENPEEGISLASDSDSQADMSNLSSEGQNGLKTEISSK